MTDTTQGEFLTVEEARAIAKCDRKTIYRWFAAEKITRYEVNGHPRVKRTELHDFLTPKPVKV